MEEASLVGSRSKVAGTLGGCQKRLLNLALELLSNRRILFWDEPTAGLDARSSLELMTVVERISINVSYVDTNVVGCLRFPNSGGFERR